MNLYKKSIIALTLFFLLIAGKAYMAEIPIYEGDQDSIRHIRENSSATNNTTGFTMENSGIGDSLLQLLLTDVTRWVFGIDNSDEDKLKIASSAELDTNTIMTLTKDGDVGIGTISPNGILSVTPTQYRTGTASQSTTTITGSGTAFTSEMIGSEFVFSNGTSAGTITAVGSDTSLTVLLSQTVSSQAYNIGYKGLYVDHDGAVGVGGAATENLMLDGDMEAAGTANWLSAAIVLSKTTINPYSGRQALMITGDGTSRYPYTSQYKMTVGVPYRITGCLRNGTANSMLVKWTSGATIFSTASTDWVCFDEVFTPDNPRLIIQVNQSGDTAEETGYADNIRVTEIGARFVVNGKTNDGSSKLIMARDSDDETVFVVDSDGKVGIGSSNPSQPLVVRGNDNSILPLFQLFNNDGNSNSGVSLGFRISNVETDVNMANITAIRTDLGGGAATDLIFSNHNGSSNTEHMRIMGSGNIGIGTDSPTIDLAIGDTDTGFEQISDGILTVKTNGNEVVRFDSNGDIIIGTEGGGARTLYVKGSSATGNAEGGELQLYMSDDYDATYQSWMMDIYEDDLRVLPTSSAIGVKMTPGATSWVSNSDIRLKENISNVSVLDKLDNYRLVEFDWKENGSHDIGVIAQEVYENFPFVVNVGKENLGEDYSGAWGVKYSQIAPIALQGVKELKEENDMLKAELCKKDNSYSWCVE